jgi:undecaprenyl-diphosphatase
MTIFEVILLGLVQGVTEFLPVSSSGHLVLVRDVFNIAYVDAVALDVVLHLGTLLAVIMYFSKDLWLLLQTFLRALGRLPVNEKDLILLKALIIGTIPAGLAGFFMESLISMYLSSGLIVAGLLFVGAIFFMYAEWRYEREPRTATLTVRNGWYIGLWQMLALMPGISRSGITMVGGMLLGMTRLEASRFSFLLAIPIITGAGLKKSIDLLAMSEPAEPLLLLGGGVIAFVTALLVIHLFLGFISRYSFWPFIWYSMTLAALVGYLHFIAV